MHKSKYGPDKTVITKETAKVLQELLRQLIVREVSMTRREHLLQILEELDGDSNYYVTWGGDE